MDLIRLIRIAIVLIVIGISCRQPVQISPRTLVDFNSDWHFIKDNAESPVGLNLNDPAWRQLNLPHDWAIEGPFTKEVSYKGGYLPYPGTGWYRKSFEVPADSQNIMIEFDGIMRNSRIWLNGEYIGGWPYGYTSFAIDITEKVKKGNQNIIEVRVENEDRSSRWYPGSGIYRSVRLIFTNPVHVAHWGTFVTTPEINDELSKVRVATTIGNQQDDENHVELTTYILNMKGREVAQHIETVEMQANSEIEITQDLEISNPVLWDLDTPYLYKVISAISQDGVLLDEYETLFGIRSFYFDADEGFFLNGRHVKLKGVNLHHDLGPLGAAVNKRATERQLEIMKEMGVNAIRTAHNPPSVEQLDLCDKMGILVIDETFDTWDQAKYGVENDYSIWFEEWYLKDTKALIRRDRNHPSIILWSIGNEVMNLDSPEGKQFAKDQAALCKELDPSRPVMAGVHLTTEFDQELREIFDVFGMNYWQDRYEMFHEKFPDLPLLASESSASLSSRGEYHFPVEEIYSGYVHESKQLSSYDLTNTGFGTLPDNEFTYQKAPWMAGQFVWSGFDYHGEPDPYEEEFYPAHSSYFGIVDMCGFKKDRFYLYQSQWTDEPMIHVLPHWNWPGREGEITPVYVYSNCSEVELIVNGESQGRKKKAESIYRFKWEDVRYQPGSIKALGYDDNGALITEKEIKTAGPASKIELIADRTRIMADGEDLSFITVRVTDEEGNLCPDADHLLEFDIEGEGTLAAVGNGDPTSVESYQEPKRSVFHGMCLLIIKSNKNPGDIRITAKSNKLESAVIKINTEYPKH